LIPAPPAASGALRMDADREPGLRGPYTQIEVDRIRPNPQQPRRVFDTDELSGLSDSIVRHGLLHPVVVRESAGGYELVVGERRWRAARLAGLTSIPAMVKDVASPELLEMALVENVQRHDLNPIELALAFRVLAEGGATQEQIGERVGLDRSTIANHLRLLDLPRELQQDVETGALSAGHAKALLQIDNPERRRHLRDRIVTNQLSVRAAEELARSLAGTRTPTRRRPRGAGDAVDPHVQQLVDTLRDQLQTKVRITGAGGRGKIEIEYYGPEDLHRITRAILESAP
jgi:ParB family chromosome partitioning protein